MICEIGTPTKRIYFYDSSGLHQFLFNQRFIESHIV